MSEFNEITGWVSRAEEDFQIVRLSLRRKTPMTYGATFHAQQCAEKYIKALLAFRKVQFPRIHDLAALNTLCQANGIFLPIKEEYLELLTAYAVEVRYPGAQPTLEDAKESFEIAKTIRKFARTFLGY